MRHFKFLNPTRVEGLSMELLEMFASVCPSAPKVNTLLRRASRELFIILPKTITEHTRQRVKRALIENAKLDPVLQ